MLPDSRNCYWTRSDKRPTGRLAYLAQVNPVAQSEPPPDATDREETKFTDVNALSTFPDSQQGHPGDSPAEYADIEARISNLFWQS